MLYMKFKMYCSVKGQASLHAGGSALLSSSNCEHLCGYNRHKANNPGDTVWVFTNHH